MSASSSTPTADRKLTTVFKLIYGSGDIGRASFNTLRMIFYAIFLTDVVGLDPRLASVASLVSIIWDAINDPIVGALSDNVRTKWGRRRPFLMIFAVPFALVFLMLWWAPPWENQILLMLTVTLAYMISDTVQTLISVPYLSLTPEIADDYDERTSLTTFRMMWNLIASLATAALAPAIVDGVVANGATLQQGYLTVAAIFGGISIVPFMLIFAVVRERTQPAVFPHDEHVSFKNTLKEFVQNTPFQYATGIYVANWIAFDTVSLMLPFFLLYWVGSGNLLASVNIFGVNLGLETIALGTMFLVAILTLPLWNWAARKMSKPKAYLIGIALWLVIESLVLTVGQGQYTYMLVLCFFVGIFTSNAHVIPEAMFPDVIDWAELRTNQRREGTYYGAINFIRKLASAVANFLALQILGWSGYQTPPLNETIFTQSTSALNAIRFLTGPMIILFLLVAGFFTLRYPLTRDRQHRIRHSLDRRQRREERKQNRQL